MVFMYNCNSRVLSECIINVFIVVCTHKCVCVMRLRACVTPQCQAVKAVEREAYVGDVAVVNNSGRKDGGLDDLDTPTRACTRHGGLRDLHESSFSLSGNTRHPPPAPSGDGTRIHA